MADEFKELLKSIAETIQDYRADERAGIFGPPEPNAEHVETWINQFDEDVRLPILQELNHVLERTYLSRTTVDDFLGMLVTNEKLVGESPAEYWSNVNLLDIQLGGSSQHVMLEKFKEMISLRAGVEHTSEGHLDETFIYIDDASFSGGRVKNDLQAWIETDAPENAKVEIIVLAFHRSGQYWAKKELTKVAKKCGKNIKFTWWRRDEVENRITYRNSLDVLCPAEVPDDDAVRAYYEEINEEDRPVRFRQTGGLGTCGFFSTEEGRALLENEFTKKGVEIRNMCPNLDEYQRPLGRILFNSFGFGSLLVTHRNCPNNSPLVFWVGAPWYPLFPRVTN